MRVHPRFSKSEKLPPILVTKNIWDDRFEDIRSFERYLAATASLSQVLPERLEERAEAALSGTPGQPEKNWKFSADDITSAQYWDDYMKAYEDMIRHTATNMRRGTSSPPTTSGSRASRLRRPCRNARILDLGYPKVDAAKRKELEAARRVLVEERLSLTR